MKFDWLSRLRKKSFSSHLISKNTLFGDLSPSLFVFGNMNLPSEYFEDPRIVSRIFGNIGDISFASGWQQPPSIVQERTYDFTPAGFCIDRFLRVEGGACGNALARIEIKECHVRDERHRSDIDYTGFEVCIVLRQEAFRQFLDHLAAIESDDSWEREFPRLAIRIPTHPFAFPPTRGCPNPWATGKNAVGKLNQIRVFNVDNITFTKLSGASHPSQGSLQDRYGVSLHSTLSLRFE